MSLAWLSFCSTPSLISQQSLSPGLSHIFGALSVLKIRQASRLLPSKSDFHGPGFPADWAEPRRRQSTSGIMDAMPERYIMTLAKRGRYGRHEKRRIPAAFHRDGSDH